MVNPWYLVALSWASVLILAGTLWLERRPDPEQRQIDRLARRDRHGLV